MSDFDTKTISTMATKLLEVSMAKVAMENFNAETTQVEHDLVQVGVQHDHNGYLVQVDTPWAMGFVDGQGVSLV